jgi:hypothetical protein
VNPSVEIFYLPPLARREESLKLERIVLDVSVKVRRVRIEQYRILRSPVCDRAFVITSATMYEPGVEIVQAARLWALRTNSAEHSPIHSPEGTVS